MSSTTLFEHETALACPTPLRHHTNVLLAHGGGGTLTRDLIRDLFTPAFNNELLNELHDGAVIPMAGRRLAFSTDSFVVSPVLFPGGNIGSLAVNGTVNDLAMCGAIPLHLCASFILEEGFPMDTLRTIVASMSAAAAAADVTIVTGDTKVVERGKGDGLYITTAGIGLIDGADIKPDNAAVGDAIIVSGPIGMHGIAVLSVREGLEFGTAILSDTAPLHTLVQAMLQTTREVYVLRDPTRGGVATSLNEIAESSGVGILLREEALPIPPEVKAACEILGLDPLYVANEGKLLAFVPDREVDHVLAAMHAHPLGRDAVVIGRVTDEHPGTVLMKTRIGGTRVVDMLSGEQLPRIC
ncbi:MAG TPA: hydrogenase expression/formation protein HypE [Bacteroidota bacterium]